MTYCKYSYFLMHDDGPEYETTCRAGTAVPFFRHLLPRSLRRQHHFTSLTVAAVAGPSPSHAVAGSGSVAVSCEIALWPVS